MSQTHPLRPGMFPCPAHQDRRPSLHVTQAADGRWLLHCFAGCDVEAILRAWGLAWADLTPGREETYGPRPNLSPEDRARWAVWLREERARARRAAYTEQAPALDELRHRDQIVTRARAIAPDTEEGWDLLAAAADLERQTWNMDR